MAQKQFKWNKVDNHKKAEASQHVHAKALKKNLNYQNVIPWRLEEAMLMKTMPTVTAGQVEAAALIVNPICEKETM